MQEMNLRRQARALGKAINQQMFRLGEILSAIHGGGFYHEWDFTRWSDYVESEVGISVVSSYDLLAIVRWRHAVGLNKKQRERLEALGRCKAALLARLYHAANVDTWLSIAEQSTVVQLRGKIYGETGDSLRRAAGFWMTERQRKSVERAISVAKQREGDDLVRGDLLAHICEVYYQQERKQRSSRKKAA